MEIFYKTALQLPVLLLFLSCNAPVNNENTIIQVKTTLGDFKLKLYDETPIHRDNFIRLIKTGIYEDVSFHRIIKGFMIQAGDLSTKSVPLAAMPDSINTYTIPAEFNRHYFHKKGALAAARQGNDVNPEMRSSGTQFYIVQGVIYNDDDITRAEQNINNNFMQSLFNKIIKETSDSVQLSGKIITDAEIQEIASVKMFQYLAKNENYKIPEEHRTIYKKIGGTPALDGTYTVFGEVIEGLDVIDRIAATKTDISDKPIDDIKIIKMKIVNK
jgi:peptidylprolyl isomerase